MSRQCLPARAPVNERSARPPGSGQSNPNREVSPHVLLCRPRLGSTGHAVCVLDAAGRVVLRLEVRHDAAGLAELARRLARLGAAGRAAGRHRAALGPRRRHAGRRRSPGGPDPPQRGQGLPAALPRRRRQVRSRRRLHARRHPAHRRPSLPPLRPRLRRDQGAARPGPRPRRSRRHPRRPRQPAPRLLEGFWPGAGAIFADVDSPIALAFLGRYPTPDPAQPPPIATAE